MCVEGGGGRGRERIHEYSKVIGKSALFIGNLKHR